MKRLEQRLAYCDWLWWALLRATAFGQQVRVRAGLPVTIVVFAKGLGTGPVMLIEISDPPKSVRPVLLDCLILRNERLPFLDVVFLNRFVMALRAHLNHLTACHRYSAEQDGVLLRSPVRPRNGNFRLSAVANTHSRFRESLRWRSVRSDCVSSNPSRSFYCLCSPFGAGAGCIE